MPAPTPTKIIQTRLRSPLIKAAQKTPLAAPIASNDCHEKFGLFALAIAGSGQNSVSHARLPLPNSMSNVRLIGWLLAANATPLPFVAPRASSR